MKRIGPTLVALVLVMACKGPEVKPEKETLEIAKAASPPVLDGKATDAVWAGRTWYALDQLWLGEAYDHRDFSGRYKLAWDQGGLYLLVEIEDDVFFDQYEDPLELWWDDDCVEVFVDEDNSGGAHQFDHNAFAYHVALDGNVVDLAPDQEPRLYNDHVRSARAREGQLMTWELQVRLFGDDFVDDTEGVQSVVPVAGKEVGFALAYCDNDGSLERENFIGSVFVPGEDKNRGWIDADIFGTLLLVD